MDEAIVNHIKKEYKLLIGQQTAEEIKLEVGSALPLKDEVQAEVRGRDMLTGLPKTVILTSRRSARRSRSRSARSSTRSSRRSTRRRPSLPRTSWTAASCSPAAARSCSGLDERLRHETHMPTTSPTRPLTCVAVGSGRSLEEFEVDPPRALARSRYATPALAANPANLLC